MKTSAILKTMGIVFLSATLDFSSIAFGDNNRDMVNSALDLVHQAVSENNDQRKDSLSQALKLLENETTKFHGHVGKAMKAIRAALRKIKAGDPYGTATDDIRRADSELRSAMSIAT